MGAIITIVIISKTKEKGSSGFSSASICKKESGIGMTIPMRMFNSSDKIIAPTEMKRVVYIISLETKFKRNESLKSKFISESYKSIRKKLDLSWDEWAARFSEYLAYIELLVSPNFIVFGGGISKYFDEYKSKLKCSCKIIQAHNKNDAGIIGAALSAT